MKWPFGRRQPSALEILQGAQWTCRRCDKLHRGMFDLARDAPAHWTGPVEYEPNSALRMDSDFLSEDFCVLNGEHYFVRSVLEIPVHGIADKFGFGCWGTLKRENFERYIEHFDSGEMPEETPWWSWLCSTLKPYMEEVPLGCWMHPQIGRQRPVLSVDDVDHPLARAQHDGISPEEMLAIYETYGHSPVG